MSDTITMTLTVEEARALLAAARRGTFGLDPYLGEGVYGACEHDVPVGWHCHRCGERNLASPGRDGYRGSAAGPRAIDHYSARCTGCGHQARLHRHRDIENQEPHLSQAVGLLAASLG